MFIEKIDRFVFVLFVVSSVLLPVAFNALKIAILLSVLYMIFRSKLGIEAFLPIPQKNPFYFQLILFFMVFCWGWLISVFNSNNLYWAFQDSFGFVFYFLFPFILFFSIQKKIGLFYLDMIYRLSFIIAIVSIIISLFYYLCFGAPTLESLSSFNEILKNFGFTWKLSASNRILRINSKVGHFLLIGLGWSLIRLIRKTNLNNMFGVIIFFLGILADGHRILFISSMLLLLIFMTIRIHKGFVLLGLICVCAIACSFFELTNLYQRFSFSEFSSVSVREQQIPALLDEIEKHPFIGNGFGSFAYIIRSKERPFMYEVDFLAVIMKLGIVAGLVYFFAYISIVFSSLRLTVVYSKIYCFGLGICFFLYSGSNGGFAMSPISALFHTHFFLILYHLNATKTELYLGEIK